MATCCHRLTGRSKGPAQQPLPVQTGTSLIVLTEIHRLCRAHRRDPSERDQRPAIPALALVPGFRPLEGELRGAETLGYHRKLGTILVTVRQLIRQQTAPAHPSSGGGRAAAAAGSMTAVSTRRRVDLPALDVPFSTMTCMRAWSRGRPAASQCPILSGVIAAAHVSIAGYPVDRVQKACLWRSLRREGDGADPSGRHRASTELLDTAAMATSNDAAESARSGRRVGAMRRSAAQIGVPTGW